MAPSVHARLRRVAMLSVHTSPLDPTRRRRRRRHERLHRRDREAPRGSGCRGRDLHPGHRERAGTRRPARPRRHRPARQRRAVRGTGQGRPVQPVVRVHRRGAADRGLARARLLRPRPLALLALGPGRLAGPRAVGRAARALGAHSRSRQEPLARRRGRARAPRAGDRRAAGRRRGRPADRLHPRRGRPTSSGSTTPTPPG